MTSIIKDFKDATEPLEFVIIPSDCISTKPGDPKDCVQGRALQRNKRIDNERIYLNISYIWWKGDIIPTRYQNTPRVRRLAESNDRKKLLVRELRKEFIKNHGRSDTFILNPPRRAISKEYMRSDEFKALRSSSAKKSKNKPARRRYTKPKHNSLRSGTGLAHLWEQQE